MNRRTVALVVLILFSAFTVYAMMNAQESLIDFGVRLMSSSDTAQVVLDLYIFCAMACVWMYHDNKRRGKDIKSVLPYFLLTAVFASIGPLLYLVLNTDSEQCGSSRI